MLGRNPDRTARREVGGKEMTMSSKTIGDAMICETVRRAIDEAERDGDNWADRVDIALYEIGVMVDAKASRAEDTNGYGPICVLADGRKVCQIDGTNRIIVEASGE